ncbi:hypothetical protein N0V94_001416 [Neodidymelliopsis sp. IMI 364377]|nr:hypothetical protein N0V94_001416 [Neodidymelliopsis sp. IMI 364377]
MPYIRLKLLASLKNSNATFFPVLSIQILTLQIMLLEKLPVELVEQIVEFILDDDNPGYLENLLGINKPFERLVTRTFLRQIKDKTSPMERWKCMPLRIRARMARDTLLTKPRPGTKRDIVSYMHKVVDILLLYADTFDPNGAGLLSREKWLSEICDILAPHEADCQCGRPAFMHQKCYDLAFVRDTAFHVAILGGHTALEIAMIEDGRSFDSVCPYMKVSKRDPRFARRTALEWACAYGFKDSVQRLVEVAKLEGTKPETYIPTAAAIAAARGHLDLFNILIGYIANLSAWRTILRFQNQTISLREWNRRAYKHIFGPKGNVKKSEYYQVWPKTVDHINTWSATSIPVHARKRRVINYAFSESALRGAEVFVHSNVDRWLELLGRQKENGEEWTGSIDMADQVTYLVFDILGDLCFGKCFDMKEPENKLRHVPEMMIGFMELIHPIACSPLSSLYVWMKPRGLDKLLATVTPPAIEKWTEFVDECLSKRTNKQKELEEKPKAEADTRKDFFHWLFNAKDPETGTGYSLPELYAECELLTIAGSDTTAIVISASYFYLSRSPMVQEKLAHEILSSFDSYDEIKAGPKLQSCQYLTAFLHEAMRMSPPVPAEPSREVLEGGTTVNGHYFPQGSLVSTAFWAMHYNKEYYPEPLQFRPERWIANEAGSTAESVALAESAFCAFSAGSRGCVGKNMAWLEMRIVMAKTLWKYEIKQDPKNGLGGGSADARPGRREEGQYQTYEMFVSNRKGPMVQLKERAH